MARLTLNHLQPLPADTLHHPVILVIDMVNGFTKAGALADAAIAKAAGPIQNLITKLDCPVWFICDAHDENSSEFASFPPHCIKGTEEAQIMDELIEYSSQENTIYKNCISAFASPEFEKVLKALPEQTDILLTGCCTDLCVEQLALPLQSWLNQNNRTASRVIVPADCIDTYHIPDIHDAAQFNEEAIKRMAACGVKVVSEIIA